MGVRGLFEKCLEGEGVGETVDLVQLAKETQKGVEVLVDYYAFQQEVLIDSFISGLRSCRGNGYLKLSGGEYQTLERYLSSFIHSLKACNIEMVFYVDGSRGSSQEEFDRRIGLWSHRRQSQIDGLKKVLDVCKKGDIVDELLFRDNVHPLLIEEQVLHVLRSCGCEINQCPVGDADLLIAKEFNCRPRACAILSNDIDFCLISGCKLILFQNFDLDKKLRIGSSLDVPGRISELMVKIITNEHMINLFQLDDHRMMVELTIVLGNDFTRGFMGTFHQHLDIQGRKTPDGYAEWIREKREIEESDYLRRQMSAKPEFRKAVDDSRGFFSLAHEPEEPKIRDETTKIIAKGIKDLQYRVKVMPLHNGIYFGPLLAGDSGMDRCSSEDALLPIRKVIYQMVRPLNQSVKELDVDRKQPIVVQIEEAVGVPSLATVAERQGSEENSRDFHCLMNQVFGGRRDGHENWFEKYSITDGIMVYLMRYFLCLNWQRNLDIKEKEFLALVVMVLDSSRIEEFQAIAVRPSVRCVKIFTWLQNVYRHLYLLGSLFNLTNKFPMPSSMFSGAAWAVLYVSCDDTHYLQFDRSVGKDKNALRGYMNSVLNNKSNMLEDIVEGFFSPKRRF